MEEENYTEEQLAYIEFSKNAIIVLKRRFNNLLQMVESGMAQMQISRNTAIFSQEEFILLLKYVFRLIDKALSSDVILHYFESKPYRTQGYFETEPFEGMTTGISVTNSRYGLDKSLETTGINLIITDFEAQIARLRDKNVSSTITTDYGDAKWSRDNKYILHRSEIGLSSNIRNNDETRSAVDISYSIAHPDDTGDIVLPDGMPHHFLNLEVGRISFNTTNEGKNITLSLLPLLDMDDKRQD